MYFHRAKEEQYQQQQGDYDQIVSYLNTQITSLQDQIKVYQVQAHSSMGSMDYAASRGMIPRVPSKNSGMNRGAISKSRSEVVSFDENDTPTPTSSSGKRRVNSKDSNLDAVGGEMEQDSEPVTTNGNVIVYHTQDTLILVKEVSY